MTPLTHHFTTIESLRDLFEVHRAGTNRRIAFVEGGFQLKREPLAAPSDPSSVNPVVRVCGPEVVCFTGFSWGYGGEGPQGLCTLLHYLGMPMAAAQEYVMRTLTWDSQPNEEDFKGGKQFLRTWRLERASWMPTPSVRKRRGAKEAASSTEATTNSSIEEPHLPIPDHLLGMSAHPIGLAIDHLIYRRMPGLDSRKAVATCVGLSDSYLSLLIRGKRPPSADLAQQCVDGLSRVPGVQPADLASVQCAFDHALRRHNEQQAAVTGKQFTPEIDPSVAYLRKRIHFLESDEQPEHEPLADSARPIVVAMIATALRQDLCACATRLNGEMVNLVQDHPEIPHLQPIWYIEIRGGGRLGREDEDLVYTQPEMAADKFIDLVGSWAAMNALRRSLLEIP